MLATSYPSISATSEYFFPPPLQNNPLSSLLDSYIPVSRFRGTKQLGSPALKHKSRDELDKAKE